MAADPATIGTATSSALGLDLLLRADQVSNTLQLIDLANSSQLIQERDLNSSTPFVIQGSAAADRLQIDYLAPFTYHGEIRLDAGGGRDEVQLSTSGLDEFALAGADTSSGSVSAEFGANHFTTTGLELLEQHGPIQAVSLTGTDQADAWIVFPKNTQQMEVQGLGGFGSTILLEAPSQRLALNTKGNDDYVSILDVHLDLVDLTIQGGAGDDTIELTNVQAARSDLVIAGGAGIDTLLIDHNELSRSNVSVLGGVDDDTLLVAGSQLDRSDLLVQGDLGHDDLKLDFNQLSRSNLLVIGGSADVTTEYAADFDLDGDVDANDYAKWKTDYRQNADSDANGDGVSDAADYTIWRNTLGSGADQDDIGITRLQLGLSTVDIRAGGSEDRISIDDIQGEGLNLDGGRGIDILSGPQSGASWIVTGANDGTLQGYSFADLENVIGSDSNSDHFVVTEEGEVDGVLSGGDGSGDALELQGADGGDLSQTITGPTTGVATIGGRQHVHAGFETIVHTVTPDTQTLTLDKGSNVQLFPNPDGSLSALISYAFAAEESAAAAPTTGGASGASLGTSVAGAGDVNADGYEDLLVGAPGLDRAYLLWGSAAGIPDNINLDNLDAAVGISLVGGASSSAGASVAAAGDWNDDGISDVVIGSPGAATAYVVFGSESLAASIDLTSLDGNGGFTITGDPGDATGVAVAGAGDLNGDLIADVIVGAPEATTAAGVSGRAVVIYGSTDPAPAAFEIVTLGANEGLLLDGLAAGDRTGASVAGGHDLNADGVPEVVIGAPGSDVAGADSGTAYIVFGSAGSYPGTVDVSTLDGSTGFVVSGTASGDAVGTSVALIADIQGDNLDELVVTAPGRAEALVLFGSGGAFAAEITFAEVHGINGFLVDAGAQAGSTLVATNLGDINDDGIGDLAFGIPDAPGTNGAGSAFVVLSETGLGSSGMVTLDTLAGDDGFRLDGVNSGDAFSTGLGVGDFNGDGIADLAAGAPTAESSAGKFAVLAGRSDGASAVTHVYQAPTTLLDVEGMDTSASLTIGATDGSSSPLALPGAAFQADLTKSEGNGIGLGQEQDLAWAYNPGKIEIQTNSGIITENSSGDSADINLSAGTIFLDEDSILNASASSGSFDPGDVTLLAKNIIDTTEAQFEQLLDDGVHLVAEVEIAGGVTILGGTIDVDAKAGDRSLDSSQANVAPGFDFGQLIDAADLPLELIALPISVFYKRATAEVNIGDGTGLVQIQGTGDVSIETDATSFANGEALFWFSLPGIGGGAAGAVVIVDATAKTHLYDQVQIQSGGDVVVKADATTHSDAVARVSLNINKSISGNDFPTNPNNVLFSVIVNEVTPTAHVDIDAGVSITAAGSIEVDAAVDDAVKGKAQGTSYNDGLGAFTFAWQESHPDVHAIVNGKLSSSAVGDTNKTTSFNPMIDVDYANDTLPLGGVSLKTGDEIVYSSEISGPVQPLQNGASYYAIVDESVSGQFQLALTKDDAKAGTTIDFLPWPTLTDPGSQTFLAFSNVDPSSNEIFWDFDHGIDPGTALTYTAVSNREVRGLTDGTVYYALAGSNPMSLQIAATPGGPAITLDTTPYFEVVSTGAILDVESFDDARQIVTFTQDHDLQAGDAIIYHGTLGISVLDPDAGNLLSGQTVYAITETSQTVDLAATTIRLADTAEAATSSDGYTNAIDFESSVVVTSGAQHEVAKARAAGINIAASYLGSSKLSSTAGIGSNPVGTGTLTKPELWGNLPALRQAAQDKYNSLFGGGAGNKQPPGNVNTDSSSHILQASAGFLYYRIEGQVQAIVGSDADLEALGEISVLADSQLTTGSTSSGKVTMGTSSGTTVAFGGAVTVGGTDLTVQAIVNGGAEVDAFGILTVDAEQLIPFIAPVENPSQYTSDVIDALKHHPSQLSGLMHQVPYLESQAINRWTRATSDLRTGTADLAVTVDLTTLQGSAEAIIAAGAQINQDQGYWNDSQAVVVNARSLLHTSDITGVFDINLSPLGLIKGALKKQPSSALEPQASSGNEGGLGFALAWVQSTIHTEAAVGVDSPVDDAGNPVVTPGPLVPASVTTGSGGGLSMTAHTEVLAIELAQSGASATAQTSYGFAGGINLYEQTSTTKAIVASGTVVTGGTVDVSATDDSKVVAATGDISKAATFALGASVNVVTVHRTTEAYIGSAGDQDGATGVDFTGLASGADVNVTAHNTGFVYGYSLGGSFGIDSGAPSNPTDNWRENSDQSVDDRNLPVQQVPEIELQPITPEALGASIPASSSFGSAVSGDAAFVQLHDVTMAFVDDPGMIVAEDISVTATNDTQAGALSGALAITDANTVESTALSGSYTEVNLHENQTVAYIEDATITASGNLDVTATRSGDVWSLAASGGGTPRDTGLELVGSASFISANQSVRARIENATLTLGDDANVTASDHLTFQNIAGGVATGGEIGIGGAYAITKLEAVASSLVLDSTITQIAGSLALDASMGSQATTPRVATVAGAGTGNSSELVDTTTIAITTSNAVRAGRAVEARMEGSTYTNTGSGDLQLSATDNTSLQTGAGAVSAAGALPVGVAVAVNFAHNSTLAAIEDTTISLSASERGNVELNATNNVEAGAYALGVAAAGMTSDVAGSSAANAIERRATARILGSDSVTTGGDVSLDATIGKSAVPEGQVIAAAGAFGVPAGHASSAAGAAVSVNQVSDHAQAHISDATVSANDVSVAASGETGAILGVAVGLELADNFADGGSVTINLVTSQIEAQVDEGSAVSASGDAKVSANETGAKVIGSAGQVSGAPGVVGVEAFGAGIVENHVHSTVDAAVRGATLSGDTAGVTANRENPFLFGLALGGSGSTGFAAGAAVVNQDITHHTHAKVTEAGQLSGTSSIAVQSEETGTQIIGTSGNFEVGKGSIGAASVSQELDNEVLAFVGSQKAEMQTTADGSAAASASGSGTIKAKSGDAFQMAIAVGGTGASGFALGGSVAVNDNTRTVDAHVANASVDAHTGLTIDSEYTNSTVTATAGTLDIQYSAGMSGGDGSGSQVDGRQAMVELVDLSVEDMAGVDEEAVDDSLKQVSQQQNLLDALTNFDLDSDEAVVPPNDALIPLGEAVEEPELEPEAGLGSVGAAAAINTLDDTTSASVINASASSDAGDVQIAASASDLVVAVAGAGTSATNSTLTGAAAGAANDLTRTTEAKIDGDGGSSSVSALGNVVVDADSLSHAITIAGNAAYSNSANSIGISTAVLDRTDTTEAIVDDATVEANSMGANTSVDTGIYLQRTQTSEIRGISVEATSRDVLTTVAAGLTAGSGAVDLAASVSVNETTDHTKARVLSGAVLSPSDDVQDINVFADNDLTVQGGGGALGIGSAGTFGAGLSADGGSITTVTEAQLAPSTAVAIGDVTVQALSQETLSSWEGTGMIDTGSAPTVAGTVGVHLFDLTTRAFLGADDGSTTTSLDLAGNLLVAADDQLTANYLAGDVVGDASGANFGVAVGYAHVHKTTEAFIDSQSTVLAFGEPDPNDDPLNATTGSFAINYGASTDPEGEVQPPGTMVPNPGDPNGGTTGSPVDDPALTGVRTATPNFTALTGIAVTATSRDTVKGVVFSVGAGAGGGLETSAVARTGQTTTRAYVGGNVMTTEGQQEIRIAAAHDSHMLTVAGGAAIGADLSVTPSLGWSELVYTTEAYVDQGAVLSATEDINVEAVGTEHLTGVVAGFSLGAAGLDASVGFVSINNSVQSWVDSGASVTAHGNVAVLSSDDTTGTFVVGAAAAGLSGIGVGASYVQLDVVKNTSAEISSGAAVTGLGNSPNTITVLAGTVGGTTVATKPVVGVAVQASSSEDITNVTFAGGGGELAGIAGAGTYAHINSDTTASIDGGALVNPNGNGAAQQAVAVGAANVSIVENWAGGLSVGSAAIGGAVDVGIMRNDTTATIGADALVLAQGDIDVFAVSARKAESRGLSAAAGVAGIAGSVSVWTLGREVSTDYTTGSSNQNSSGITGDALTFHGSPSYSSFADHGDAQPNRTDLQVALGGYQDGEMGTASSGNASLATIGLTAQTNIAAATPSDQVSTAMNDTTESSTIASIEESDSNTVQAQGNLAVKAAEAATLDVALGAITVGVVGVGASVGVANVHGGATAYVLGDVLAGGDITIEADYNGDLKSQPYSGGIDAFAAIGASVAVIDDDAVQQAYVGDGATILAADSLSASAQRIYNQFEATAFDGEAATAAAGAAVAKINARGATEAWVGDAALGGNDEPTVGDVSITVTSKISPQAGANALAAGVAAGTGNRADALVTPTVDAHVGSGTSAARLNLSGDLTIDVISTATPHATGSGVSAGAVDVGVSQTTAEASPTISAYIAEDAVVDADNITFMVVVGDDPESTGSASAGGALQGTGVDATAKILSHIESYIDAGVQITTTGDVEIEVDHSAVGGATASGIDLGGVSVGENDATLNVKPVVMAYIAAKQVTAGGSVLVKAHSGAPGTFPELDFDAGTGVDYSNNTITFAQPHGLEGGDFITYDTRGGAVIGGLIDGQSYPVIKVSDTAIQLGATFDQDAIDPNAGTIQFPMGHTFNPGDAIIYDAQGNSPLGGITDGGQYWTNLLDPYNVKLANSQDVAENLDNFRIADFMTTDDTLSLGAVYLPSPYYEMRTKKDDHHMTPVGTDPQWQTGDVVWYVPGPGDQLIQELGSDGTPYYVSSASSGTEYHLTETLEQAQNGNAGIKYGESADGYFVTVGMDGVPTSPWLFFADPTNCPDCAATAFDNENNVITFDPNAPFEDGDIVAWGNLGDLPLGIPQQLYYLASVTTDSEANKLLQLAVSESEKSAGNFVNINGTDPSEIVLGKPYALSAGDHYTYRAPIDIRFTSADINPDGSLTFDSGEMTTLFEELQNATQVIYDVADTSSGALVLPGLTPGKVYEFNYDGGNNIIINGVTLVPSGDENDVNPTEHIFRISGNDPLFALNDGDTYYLITDGLPAGDVKLADSADDASAGNFIGLDPVAFVNDVSYQIIEVVNSTTVSILNDIPFSTGDRITYHEAAGLPISPLVDGQEYYAIVLTNAEMQFALSASDAQSGNAITLDTRARFSDSYWVESVDQGNDLLNVGQSTSLQTGDTLVYQGGWGDYIVGLDIGETYYVILPTGSDGSQIALSATLDGATSSDASPTLPSNRVQIHSRDPLMAAQGIHYLSNEGLSVTPPASPGTHLLIYDLTNNGLAMGTQGFQQSGTADNFVTGQPKLKATGSNGNLVGDEATKATATIEPTVQAFLGDPSGADTAVTMQVMADGLVVQSTTELSLTAESTGYDLSVLVGGGTAKANVTTNATTESWIGSGASVMLDGSSSVTTGLTETLVVNTDATGGGAIDSLEAHSVLNMDATTTTTIGEGASLLAGGTNEIGATATTNAKATAKGHPGGIVVDPQATSKLTTGASNGQRVTEVIIGDNSSLSAGGMDSDGYGIKIYATINHGTFYTQADSRSSGVIESASSDAEVQANELAQVSLKTGVMRDDAHTTAVQATMGWTNMTSYAESRLKALGGDTSATAKTNVNGGTEVSGTLSGAQYTNLVTPGEYTGKAKAVTRELWHFKAKGKTTTHNNNNTTESGTASSTVMASLGTTVGIPFRLAVVAENPGRGGVLYADEFAKQTSLHTVTDKLDDIIAARLMGTNECKRQIRAAVDMAITEWETTDNSENGGLPTHLAVESLERL